MTAGIVSALRRTMPTAEGHEIAGGIQTDASAQSRKFRRPLARQLRPFDRRNEA